MQSIEKQMLFLLTKKREISANDFVRIYTKQGYKEQSIRNILSRLKKEAYVRTGGRSVYAIEEKGKEFLAVVNRKPGQYDIEWRHTWFFVHFEIPETLRTKRDRLRYQLLQLGFGQLYKGVYVSPWDYRKQVVALIRQNGVEAYVTLSEGAISFNEITKERAAAIWPLEDIHRLYEEKRAWYKERFLPELNRTIQEGMDPLQLFGLFLHVGEALSDIMLKDPMLPLPLLPDDWIGHLVIQELHRSFLSFATLIPHTSEYYDFLI